MFTVKHIRLSGGEELYPTASVRYEPGSDSLVGQGRDVGIASQPPTLWIDSGPLTGGTVFVMNENGKTVSRYDLGASPVGFHRDAHLTSQPEDILSSAKCDPRHGKAEVSSEPFDPGFYNFVREARHDAALARANPIEPKHDQRVQDGRGPG